MPAYPHSKLPAGVKRRDSTLYSIAGWMSSWYGWEAIEEGTAFGGYFRFDHETHCIEGEIVDSWGAAKIAGMLDEDRLTFDKTYLLRANPNAAPGIIEYEFKKDGDGWKGGFTLTFNDDKGRAECKILPVVRDAFQPIVGPINKE